MNKLQIARLPEHEALYQEMKDTSIVSVPDGYIKICSIGSSETQSWKMGRFHAATPEGPWTEMEPIELIGISGKEVCAPKVMYEVKDGAPHWTMYVQEKCFEMGGNIAALTSTDGRVFNYRPELSLPLDHVQKTFPNVGNLYDISVFEGTRDGVNHEYFIFSGYRLDHVPNRAGFVGCGDIYCIERSKDGDRTVWDTPHLLLEQENVPGHNRPDSKTFEWGIEGADAIQLHDKNGNPTNTFVMIHVYFKENGTDGTRQDNILWASNGPLGPYYPMGPLLEPSPPGENGHAGIIKADDIVHILYQQRDGSGHGWYQCHLAIPEEDLLKRAQAVLDESGHKPAYAPKHPQLG